MRTSWARQLHAGERVHTSAAFVGARVHCVRQLLPGRVAGRDPTNGWAPTPGRSRRQCRQPQRQVLPLHGDCALTCRHPEKKGQHPHGAHCRRHCAQALRAPRANHPAGASFGCASGAKISVAAAIASSEVAWRGRGSSAR